MAALIALLVSLGIVCGHALGIIAKSELKYGKKFLNALQILLFLAATLFLMWTLRYEFNIIWIGGLAVFIFLYYFKKIQQWLVYGYLGILHAVALTTQNYLPIAALIFLYGFPAGSYIKKKEALFYCILTFVLFSVFTQAIIAKALNM